MLLQLLLLLLLLLVLQAALLSLSGGWAAQLWGISASSPLWGPASEFLSIRAVGAPITVLLLVMQVRYLVSNAQHAQQ